MLGSNLQGYSKQSKAPVLIELTFQSDNRQVNNYKLHTCSEEHGCGVRGITSNSWGLDVSLCSVSREGLSDKVTSEQRPKGNQGVGHAVPEGRAFHAKGMAATRVLRQTCRAGQHDWTRASHSLGAATERGWSWFQVRTACAKASGERQELSVFQSVLPHLILRTKL